MGYCFLEYERYKNRFNQAQEHGRALESIKARILERSLPGPASLERAKVNGGERESAEERYIINLERSRIDERIKAAKRAAESCGRKLAAAKNKLISSEAEIDRIYYYKYIQRQSIKEIAEITGFTIPIIFQFLLEISDTIEAELLKI